MENNVIIFCAGIHCLAHNVECSALLYSRDYTSNMFLMSLWWNNLMQATLYFGLIFCTPHWPFLIFCTPYWAFLIFCTPYWAFFIFCTPYWAFFIFCNPYWAFFIFCTPYWDSPFLTLYHVVVWYTVAQEEWKKFEVSCNKN